MNITIFHHFAPIGLCSTHNLLSENAKITASNLLHRTNNTLLERDAPITNILLITLKNIIPSVVSLPCRGGVACVLK